MALLLTAVAAAPAWSADRRVVVRLMHYHVTDPQVVAALHDLRGADLVAALQGQPARLLEDVEVEPGRTRNLTDTPLAGSVRVAERSDGQVELTLAVEVAGRAFFRGTPLLIPVCRPFVLSRIRVRAGGPPQLSVKAVEVRSDCPP
ncbi:MAG TPA: hypothetical protein VNN07_11025 [Candidatus Tectomicrobia bacterium]|nr:hypothetical protein [Candidatus Tectomicrobia bacterium]